MYLESFCNYLLDYWAACCITHRTLARYRGLLMEIVTGGVTGHPCDGGIG